MFKCFVSETPKESTKEFALQENKAKEKFLMESVKSGIFHSFWEFNIAGERLHILTYARHLLPLSSEGSLARHTYCDTGYPFIMVISEDPWHSHLMPSVWQRSCHYLF